MEDATGATSPVDKSVVEEALGDHLPRLGRVLSNAWDSFVAAREAAAPQMAFASASSRGMLVSDFAREPAHREFASVADAWVDDRYGRPWVNFSGGAIQVRFRKLTAEYGLCPAKSARATMLAYHLGDPLFPELPRPTILTAGYILDAAEHNVEEMALVCHVGDNFHYAIPISPVDSMAGAPGTTTSPAQLPLTPLSPPIIRSAQKAARARLRLVSGASESIPSAGERSSDDGGSSDG